MQEFIRYYTIIKNQDLSGITEHSLRPALQELLSAIATEISPALRIVHEPKREGKFGAPDFKVFATENIVGYVENKKITENLDKVLKSEQVSKYKELSDNLLITNYIEWIWLRQGEVQQRETLCPMEDIANPKAQLHSDKAKAIKQLLINYLSTAPTGIADPQKLAETLAIRARLLKDFILDELKRQVLISEIPKLKGLYLTFKGFVFNDLSISAFADAFAQTLIYGLFLAKLNADTKQVNLYNVSQFIPNAFQLIRELVDFLKELENPDYKEIHWIVEEVITIMNTLNLREIQKTLSFSKVKNTENTTIFYYKDPYIYFYEDFLAAYDKNLRKAKGVYYTPSAVVNFMVKSTNEILKHDFGIEAGMADEKQVTILDFATGTGTFLVHIFQQILEEVSNSGIRNVLIREHLLKNIYGFEYLIAPYTIAHLKLSQLLQEQGYQLADKERFQVFLTNTLEPIDKQISIPLLPALTKETQEAQAIKDKPILVITGNPPYSVASGNKSSFVDNLMKKYKDGLVEKNIQAVSDDYIKFIRFAHDKIEKIGKGIIAIITNNSYLSGSIHRKMRQAIYKDFDKIYILNLHGNSLRKEQGENVFDIRVGVAILLLVKQPNKLNQKQAFYYSTQANDLWKRRDKLDFLLNNDLKSVQWTEIKPQAPDFWFIEKDLSHKQEYDKFWSVTAIFNKYGIGFSTDKDELFVDKNRNALTERMKKMLHYPLDSEFARQHKIINTERYRLLDKIRNKTFQTDSIKKINYRIFGEYFCFYEHGITSRPVPNLMQNFLQKDNNIGLVTTRLLSSETFSHVFITDKITERCFISNAGSEANYIFPLYVFEEKYIFENKAKRSEKQLRKEIAQADKRFENAWAEFQKAKTLEAKDSVGLEEYLAKVEEAKALAELLKNEKVLAQNKAQDYVKIPNFTKEFETYTTQLYGKALPPEHILGYIYALLHCPNYREKYNEFLKTDYPKIPLIADLPSFETLANIGNNLIKAHLLDDNFIASIKANYAHLDIIGEGDFDITKIDFSQNKVWINKSQYLSPIPEPVWHFKVGAYLPIQKYLKDRKGETLSLENIKTIAKQVLAIAFTLEKMQEIENLTHNWL